MLLHALFQRLFHHLHVRVGSTKLDYVRGKAIVFIVRRPKRPQS